MTAIASTTARDANAKGAWLFSRNVDVAVFGGSALLSIVMLAIGHATGVLGRETPGWAWVPSVLFVDVAHVWATGFRTYFDKKELARRPLLYAVVPVACFVAANAAYRVSEAFFWRALAYVAIAHFVRQQYGWVMLYRARAGESRGTRSHVFDAAAIYAATIGPLAYWHAHAPRRFDWFVPNDIVPVPAALGNAVAIASALALLAWAAHTCILHVNGRGNAGKTLLVATTALTWTLGIVVFDSDYAFTVTNVFAHGIPYVCLVWAYQRKAHVVRNDAPSPFMRHAAAFVGALWFLAYAEELLWDRAVYHDRPWLFGESWQATDLRAFVIPLLALPQLTHYVLDGFIWKRAKNPVLGQMWK
jgi:hypothetical protein